MILGCNPKDKNEDGFTPRLLAKEKNSKEASKELRKAEKLFAKFSKPDAINPNGVEVLHLYDWVCEREDYVKQALMKGVSFTTTKNMNCDYLKYFCLSICWKIYSFCKKPAISKSLFLCYDVYCLQTLIVNISNL